MSPSSTRSERTAQGDSAVHDDGHAEPQPELGVRREVVGVRVRVDEIMDAQPVAGRAREVTVDLPQLGIDQHCRAGVGAADEIRLAPARGDLLEDHRLPR